jgi:hypothetical protein
MAVSAQMVLVGQLGIWPSAATCSHSQQTCESKASVCVFHWDHNIHRAFVDMIALLWNPCNDLICYFYTVMVTIPPAPIIAVASATGGGQVPACLTFGLTTKEIVLLASLDVPGGFVDMVTVACPSDVDQPAFSWTVADPLHLLSVNALPRFTVNSSLLLDPWRSPSHVMYVTSLGLQKRPRAAPRKETPPSKSAELTLPDQLKLI